MDIVIREPKDYYTFFKAIEKGEKPEIFSIFLIKHFLAPMDVLILTEFIIYSLNNGIGIALSVSNDSVKDYLAAIGLFEFCSKNHQEPSEIKEIQSFTAMPIRRVNRTTMNYYVSSTQSYFQTFCQEKDLGMLNVMISELVNNVYDHSNSPIDSFVFSQFYPNWNVIKIAVSDLGYGIAQTVKNYFSKKGQYLLSDEEAVRWALKLNSTTQSMPHNAGRGLDTINSFVTSNRGSWRLFTNQILMEGRNGKCEFNQNPIENFIGTVIEITINIDNLEQLETLDVLDW